MNLIWRNAEFRQTFAELTVLKATSSLGNPSALRNGKHPLGSGGGTQFYSLLLSRTLVECLFCNLLWREEGLAGLFLDCFAIMEAMKLRQGSLRFLGIA